MGLLAVEMAAGKDVRHGSRASHWATVSLRVAVGLDSAELGRQASYRISIAAGLLTPAPCRGVLVAH